MALLPCGAMPRVASRLVPRRGPGSLGATAVPCIRSKSLVALSVPPAGFGGPAPKAIRMGFRASAQGEYAHLNLPVIRDEDLVDAPTHPFEEVVNGKRMYTVQRDDWLIHLSEMYDVGVEEIMQSNPEIPSTSPDGNLIYPGQRIELPPNALAVPLALQASTAAAPWPVIATRPGASVIGAWALLAASLLCVWGFTRKVRKSDTTTLLKGELKSKSSELQALERRYEALKEERDTELSDTRESWAVAAKGREEAASAAYRDSYDKLSESLAVETKKIRALRSELAQKDEELDRTKGDLTKAEEAREAVAAAGKALRAEMEDLEVELDRKAKEAASRAAEGEAARGELAAERAEVRRLREELDAAVSEAARMRAGIAEGAEVGSELAGRLRVLEAESMDLAARLSGEERKAEGLREVISERDRQVASLEEELELHHADLTALRARLEEVEAESAGRAGEVAALETRMEEREAHFGEQLRAAELLAEEEREAAALRAEQDMRATELRAEKERAEVELRADQDLRAAELRAEKERAEAEGAIARAQATRAELEAQLSTLGAELEGALAVRAQLADAEALVLSQRERLALLEEGTMRRDGEIAALRAELEQRGASAAASALIDADGGAAFGAFAVSDYVGLRAYEGFRARGLDRDSTREEELADWEAAAAAVRAEKEAGADKKELFRRYQRKCAELIFQGDELFVKDTDDAMRVRSLGSMLVWLQAQEDGGGGDAAPLPFEIAPPLERDAGNAGEGEVEAEEAAPAARRTVELPDLPPPEPVMVGEPPQGGGDVPINAHGLNGGSGGDGDGAGGGDYNEDGSLN